MINKQSVLTYIFACTAVGHETDTLANMVLELSTVVWPNGQSLLILQSISKSRV